MNLTARYKAVEMKDRVFSDKRCIFYSALCRVVSKSPDDLKIWDGINMAPLKLDLWDGCRCY